MKYFVVAAAIAVAALSGLAGPARAATSPATSDTAAAAELVGRVNDLRAARGLPALTVHGELSAKAVGWADTMAAAGRIWHSTLSDGITAAWASLGENVGMGGAVGALHEAFVNSPRHYDNLVNPKFDHIGIGITRVDGVLYASEVFMALDRGAPPAPAPSAATPAPGPSAEAVKAPATPLRTPPVVTMPPHVKATAVAPSTSRSTTAPSSPDRQSESALPGAGNAPDQTPGDPTAGAVVTAAAAPVPMPTSGEPIAASPAAETAPGAPDRRLAAGAAVVLWAAAAAGHWGVRSRRDTSPSWARRRPVSNRELRQLVGRIPQPHSAA